MVTNPEPFIIQKVIILHRFPNNYKSYVNSQIRPYSILHLLYRKNCSVRYVFSLAEKRLWTARVALSEGSSRHWARQVRAWPWTVGELSIRRSNSRFWIRNLCGRKRVSSRSWHSSGRLSGCSSKTITTSTENSRCTIYKRQNIRLYTEGFHWQEIMQPAT